MRYSSQPLRGLVAWMLVLCCSLTARAETQLTLTNGYVLRGVTRPVVNLKHGAQAAGGNGPGAYSPILMVEDGLKHTFIYKNGMVRRTADAPDLALRIDIWQKPARTSSIIPKIGVQTSYTDFDEYGRRFMRTVTTDRVANILQGIVEVNSRYTRVLGLSAEESYGIDQRIPTDSIPTETLTRIFTKSIDRDDLEGRLDVVNLFIEAERFKDAREELKAIIQEFPAANQLPQRLKALTQREADQILSEALLRRDAGQYSLAVAMLRRLASVEGISRIIKLQAQDRVSELIDQDNDAKRLLSQLESQIDLLPIERRGSLKQFVQTMRDEMTFDTLRRIDDYQRLGADEKIPLENRVALAIGGWLQGSGSGMQNLAIAESLIEVRELVEAYLASEDEFERERILTELRKTEGGQPQFLARLIPLLKPPIALPEPPPMASITDSDGNIIAEQDPAETPPGYYKFNFDTPLGEVEYHLQLPSEYNPLRRYPCVLALHPMTQSALAELQFWTGQYNPRMQLLNGEAARRGYIVIAPKWSRDGQPGYEYSSKEHHRVLAALRHAIRRTSIDTNRIFLAGHHDGATAAWDIALAHPDPWAGLICIGGRAEKYIVHYNENAKYVPMYFVTGENAANSSLLENGPQWDDYMKPGYNAMVTLYNGHGEGYFYEDIKNMFDWMRLSAHRRGTPPRDLELVTSRSGDQFFWWLELHELKVDINPFLWELQERFKPGSIDASVDINNSIRVQGPSNSYTILLSPAMGLDMTQPIRIRAGGRSTTHEFDGDIGYMLEDVRKRGDRQQFYWDAVSVP